MDTVPTRRAFRVQKQRVARIRERHPSRDISYSSTLTKYLLVNGNVAMNNDRRDSNETGNQLKW